MSTILFVIGGIAVVLGCAAIAFGVPESEFSFGNTLIVAGATTAVGGLIVIGLGAVVAKLQQVADALAVQFPIVPSRSMASFDADGLRGAAPARAPFPPKPKAEEFLAAASELPFEAEPIPAPILQNPDVPSVTVEEATLSPSKPVGEAAASGFGSVIDRPAPPAEDELRHEPKLDTGWRPAARQPSAYFDAVWPAEAKPAKAAPEPLGPPDPQIDMPGREEGAAEPPVPSELEKQPAAAVLKSGVVDGMGYTLYVDGSIEAELPQGTLRFASINELRSHLEQNS
jgi:hypothetical protein